MICGIAYANTVGPIYRDNEFNEVQNREIAKEDGGLDPDIGGQARFLIEKLFDRGEYLL